MAYSLCLFDLDGTLTDPKEGITKAVRYSLNSFGIDVPNSDELTRFIGPPLRESYREFYEFTDTDAEEAVRKYREYYSDKGLFENALYPGVSNLLGRLRDQGVAMAIATCKPTVFAERVTDHFGIREYFGFVAGCELDGTRSKKGEVIEYALHNVNPRRAMTTVMIGDREHDMVGAREMGVESIGITWGYGTLDELKKANATKIAHSMDELHHLILEGHCPGI